MISGEPCLPKKQSNVDFCPPHDHIDRCIWTNMYTIKNEKPVVVLQAFIPGAKEAETGKSLWGVQGQINSQNELQASQSYIVKPCL